MRLVPFGLKLFSLASLTIAAAKPQVGIEFVRDVTKGIAIELVVDRSGSMAAEMSFDGESLTRLETVKRVIGEFVHGGAGLDGRPNDLIGMVAFARYADTVAPLTLAHGAIDGFLNTIHIVTQESEDGTSIGDALALAAARLERAGSDRDESYELKGKAIVLLTDGQNNAGQRTPVEAALLAREWGMKIYAIGIGGGESFRTVNSLLGTYRVPVGPGIDEAMLTRIASETGGIFRTAGDADALREVYREIDSLETSEIETIRFLDYREVFGPFAAAALAGLALSVILSATLFRKVP